MFNIFKRKREWKPVDICYRCRYERKSRHQEYFVCPNCGGIGKVVMVKKGNNYQPFLNYKPYRNYEGEWLVDIEREVFTRTITTDEKEVTYEQSRESKWGITEAEAEEYLKQEPFSHSYSLGDTEIFKNYGKWEVTSK